MVIAYVPLLFVILGLLAYVLAANPKLAELGRIAFFCGLFVTLWTMTAKVFRFG